MSSKPFFTFLVVICCVFVGGLALLINLGNTIDERQKQRIDNMANTSQACMDACFPDSVERCVIRHGGKAYVRCVKVENSTLKVLP